MNDGFTMVPNDGWLLIAGWQSARLREHGTPWDEELRIGDLRWWEGQVRMGKERRVPGHKALSKRWGMSEWKTRELLKNTELWSTEKQKTSRLPPADLPPTSPLPMVSPEQSTENLPSTSRPPPADLDTRGGVRTKNKEQREQHTSLQADDDSQPPADAMSKTRELPAALVEAYQRFRTASGISAKRRLNTRKGQGLKLWSIHQQAGNEAVALFDWLAGSQHERAQFYRGKHMDSTNVVRHLDTLLDLMSAPVSAAASGRNSVSGSDPEPTPSDRWESAIESHGFRHPDWLEGIPDRDKNRFSAANVVVGGVGALSECGHILDVRRLKQNFDQAFRNTP